MKISDPNYVWYKLYTEDIQEIAQEDIERKLTEEELQQVIKIASRTIDWSEAVELAIASLE